MADLPAAWGEKYQKYLGLTPPSDADGVLQDIHWAAGLVGYFPTYSLGNLYAAQFFAQADAELGGLDRQFAAGRFCRPWPIGCAKKSIAAVNALRPPNWCSELPASRSRISRWSRSCGQIGTALST